MDTRTGLTTTRQVIAALTKLRTLEDDSDSTEGHLALHDHLGYLECKDADDAEMALLRDLADMVADDPPSLIITATLFGHVDRDEIDDQVVQEAVEAFADYPGAGHLFDTVTNRWED